MDQDLGHRLVGRLAVAVLFRPVRREPPDPLLGELLVRRLAHLLDLLAVEAHLDQGGDRLGLLVRHERAAHEADAVPARVDQQLLGRHRGQLLPLALLGDLDLDVDAVLAGLGLDVFHIRGVLPPLLMQAHQVFRRQPVVFLDVDLGPLVPPPLDVAVLLNQPVLQHGIEDQKTLVLPHEDVVDDIGLLLGALLVIRPQRLELHHLVAAGENLHQLGHDPLDRVRNVGGDDEALALGDPRVLGIRLGHVGVEELRPLGADRRGRGRLRDLPRDDDPQLVGRGRRLLTRHQRSASHMFLDPSYGSITHRRPDLPQGWSSRSPLSQAM
jgi:hypothetical protein